jgi:ribosome-associated protein
MVRELLDEKKAENIVLLDVRKMSSVTDYYVVATGGSAPHLKALFSDLQHELKRKGILCYRRSGAPESGWVVMDYVDVVIHVFSAETRQYYAIEELWAPARKVK